MCGSCDILLSRWSKFVKGTRSWRLKHWWITNGERELTHVFVAQQNIKMNTRRR
jgi:hypothetical protein